MKKYGFLLLIFAINVLAQDNPPEFLGERYPMMQSSTSDREVYFNVLVPRLKDYSIQARLKNPKDKRNNPVIKGEAVGEAIRDPQALLHDKVLKFKLSGLEPGKDYTLELIENSKFGSEKKDTREFKTFANESRPAKFATVSCMCDEIVYEKPRQVLWKKLAEQNPDLVFLIGDLTYVDSFDVVERGKATDLDIWQRYINSFKVNPFFRQYRLIPTAATWDDHDTGIDNGNKNTPTLPEARRAFRALYGAFNIPGFVETAPVGLNQIIKIFGQNFVLLDNRSFRETHEVNSRFAHFGEEQEKWLISKMQTENGPFFLFNGDMWGSPTITKTSIIGKVSRLTESIFGDHPDNYNELMKSLNATGKVFVLLSGDIHNSQIIEHGPQFQGPRQNPFKTWEITSSPMHSIVFQPKPNEDVLWPDPQRVVGAKEYNFVIVQSKIVNNDTVDIEATSIGMKDQPLFKIGTAISRTGIEPSERRKLINKGFDTKNNRVKVAFFDADSTLRLAPSKSVSANGPTDVAILPGVAAKIAELNAQGFLVAIVSNQGGVAEGHVSLTVADQALRYTMKLIQDQNPNAKFHYYDMAERGKGDYFTKPSIGMGKYLELILKNQDLEIDWESSFMVGDSRFKKDAITPVGTAGADFSDADRLFAQNLDLRCYDPRTFFSWSSGDYKLINSGNIPPVNPAVPANKDLICKGLL